MFGHERELLALTVPLEDSADGDWQIVKEGQLQIMVHSEREKNPERATTRCLTNSHFPTSTIIEVADNDATHRSQGLRGTPETAFRMLPDGVVQDNGFTFTCGERGSFDTPETS
jgi:hypothetical protein